MIRQKFYMLETFMVVLLFFAAGCVSQYKSTVKQPGNSTEERENIGNSATLRIMGHYGNETALGIPMHFIVVTEMDSNPTRWVSGYSSSHFSVSPGLHTFVLDIMVNDRVLASGLRISGNFTAGHIYELSADFSKSSGSTYAIPRLQDTAGMDKEAMKSVFN